MFRWLFLVLFSPIWLPYRALRWLVVGRRRVRVLTLKVRGTLPDTAETTGLRARLSPRGSGPTLLELLRLLHAAAHEPHLDQVVVHLSDLHCGLARAEEMRAALARVRDQGKKVSVFAESMDLTEYWIALGGSHICMVPTGTLSVTGFNMEFTLLKGLLDKAGIRAQLFARGKYKSMAEMFTQSDISAANREMLESLVASLADQLQANVLSARGMTAETWRQALENAPLRAEQALAYGLVDRLLYADELREETKGKGSVGAEGFGKTLAARRVLPRRGPRVALLHVKGNITSGSAPPSRFGRSSTTSESFVRKLKKVLDAPDVSAVVLRVDSPGGSALASDVMWRELGCAVQTLARQRKPLIVSMANLAASGGYYVCGLKGVEVWASPVTLTGSIGVVAGKFEASRLMERLGIQRVQVRTGPRAGYASPTTPWSEDELTKLAEDLEYAYRDFVQKMAHARNLTFEQLDGVAQGRVWTGAQAHAHGLVDRLGGIYEVLALVAKDLNCDLTALRFWTPEGRGGLRQWLSADAEEPLLARAVEVAGFDAPLLRLQTLSQMESGKVLMLCPWLPRDRH